jgi:hypothetical protein
MLRSYHSLVCTFAAVICGIAPFTADAEVILTDHAAEQAVPRYTTLEVTILRVPGERSTCSTAINNRGQIGAYWSDSSSLHGFLLWKGRYTAIDIPNSIQTTILSINDFGDIVGTYQDISFVQHTFQSNIREFLPRRGVER